MKIEKAIVRDILNDLSGRSGIGNEMDMIDQETMKELRKTLEDIVQGHLASAFLQSIVDKK